MHLLAYNIVQKAQKLGVTSTASVVVFTGLFFVGKTEWQMRQMRQKVAEIDHCVPMYVL